MSPENATGQGISVLDKTAHLESGIEQSQSNRESQERAEELRLPLSEELDPIYLFKQEAGQFPLEISQHPKLAEKIFVGQLALCALTEIGKSGLLTPDQRVMIEQLFEDKSAKFLYDQFNFLLARKKRLRNNGKTLDEADIKLIETAEGYGKLVRVSLQKLGDAAMNVVRHQIFLAKWGCVAYQKMVEGNMRFNAFVVDKYWRNGLLPLGDLLGSAGEGLMASIAWYDPRRGIAITTYAEPRMRNRIQEQLDENRSVLSIPVRLRRRLRQFYREQAHFAQELGREPSFEELIERFGKKGRELVEAFETTQHVVLLNKPVSDGENGHTEFGDLIPDKTQDSQRIKAERDKKRRIVLSVLNDGQLSERERKVLELRFGLSAEDGRERTVREVGREFGVSRSLISQIEAEALEKLRGSLKLCTLLPQASMP